MDPVLRREHQPGCRDDPTELRAPSSELRAWARRAERQANDHVLGRLGEFALTEEAERTALVWLLPPGAITRDDGLRDLRPEIDQLSAGQFWIDVVRSHMDRPYGIARAVVNSTRRSVLAD